MKAEILEPISSPPNGEVNYQVPVPSSYPPARSWLRSIFLSLGVLVLLASFAIVATTLHSQASPTSASPGSAAAPNDDKFWYSLGFVDISGGVTPIYPLQIGRVKSIEAKENEIIKAGAPLFHVEDTVQHLKVRQAHSDLEGAKQQLAIAEAGVFEADKEIEAQKKAVEVAQGKVDMAGILRDKQKRFERQGIEGDKETVQVAEISVKQAERGVAVEEAKLALIEAKKHQAEGYVLAAKESVKAKEAQLDEARNAVNECVVRAPEDGTPLRININKGETLGANPRQPAIQFAAAKPMLVRAEVEQEFVGRVHQNQNVSVEDHVTEVECARGKVASLAQWYAPRRTLTAEIVPINSDTRTLECIIQITSTSQTLRIGQRVRVQFRD
jgi:multidrug resistance efflux pump